jgi:hypothetical protein
MDKELRHQSLVLGCKAYAWALEWSSVSPHNTRELTRVHKLWMEHENLFKKHLAQCKKAGIEPYDVDVRMEIVDEFAKVKPIEAKIKAIEARLCHV